MDYLSALRLAHARLEPRNYCEIGCRHGTSLSLSRVPSIGIDPAFELRVPLDASVQMFPMTSDDFFAHHDARLLLGGPVDLAFIDGMHLAEFALRDFINIERASHPGGVIAIDDILPGLLEHASRERLTKIWTGDVYRVILVLRTFRPDLDIRVYDVDTKGFCLISNLDPASTSLSDELRSIESDLAKGRWSCDSIDSIRQGLKPAATDRIAIDLDLLAESRGDRGSRPRASV